MLKQQGRVAIVTGGAGGIGAATADAGITANLTGPFIMTQAVGTVMRARGYGRVIFVSSLAALGNRDQANYASAKAGVAGLARTVAIELGEFGVTSNVVAPGFVDTGMFRQGLAAKGRSFDVFSAATAAATAVRRIGLTGLAAASGGIARTDPGAPGRFPAGCPPHAGAAGR